MDIPARTTVVMADVKLLKLTKQKQSSPPLPCLDHNGILRIAGYNAGIARFGDQKFGHGGDLENAGYSLANAPTCRMRPPLSFSELLADVDV